MGVHKLITHDKFPKQGQWLGRRVKVCFHYNTKDTIMGRIVRDDSEGDNPVEIIQLDNGAYVLSTECQYQLMDEDEG